MDAASIRGLIESIADPEIPVITLGDLGVIRDVRADGAKVEVDVSPTYSGCPATRVINDRIKAKLAREGIDNIRILSVLSPPWSSEWISQEGRKKLQEYGIAPPSVKKGGPEACPQCGSTALEKISEFAATPCQALWRCQNCLEPFPYFKCI